MFVSLPIFFFFPQRVQFYSGALGNTNNQSTPAEVKFFKKGSVKKVASGDEHSLILTHDFNVFGVGSNSVGQLSLKDSEMTRDKYIVLPVQINKKEFLDRVKSKRVVDIYAGDDMSIFVVSNTIYGVRTYFSVGKNDTGQLGCGDYINRESVVEMKLSDRLKYGLRQVSVGNSFTLFLSKEMEVFVTGKVWQERSYTVPTFVKDFPEKIIKIQAGFDYFLAFSKTKKIYGFGSNRYKVMTTTVENEVKKPTEIKCLTHRKIKDICCGDVHALALTEDGTLLRFGYTIGSLLSDHNKDSNGICEVKENIVQMECGRYTSFGFTKNNEIWVGGNNLESDLGLGHSNHSNISYNQLVLQNTIIPKIGIKSIYEKYHGTIEWLFPLKKSSFHDTIIITHE